MGRLAKSNKIIYKTDEEIEMVRASCLLVSKVLAHVAANIAPGVVSSKLDREAEEIIRDHGATPAFKGYGSPKNPFPGTLCVSKNEVVVHGVPSDEPFEDGDIVSIDCGVHLNGFVGDAAYTFCLGNVAEETMELCRVTNTSLYKAIAKAKVGNRLEDIGFAVQQYTERVHGYGVVRELVGHGVGRNLHEAPDVPNYGKRGKGILLREGLIIAIEPMITRGRRDIRQSNDGWTIFSRDRQPAAHYEHTVAVRKGKADILSTHKWVEEAIAKNPDVREVAIYEEELATA